MRATLAIALIAGCGGTSAPPPPPAPPPTPAELLERGCACADDACREAADAELAAAYRASDGETAFASIASAQLVLDCLGDTRGAAIEALAERASDVAADDVCACRDAACMAEQDARFGPVSVAFSTLFMHGLENATVKANIERMVACHRAVGGAAVEQAIAGMRELRDRACACADAACAAQLEADYRVFRDANAQVTGSQADAEIMETLIGELEACLANVNAAAPP